MVGGYFRYIGFMWVYLASHWRVVGGYLGYVGLCRICVGIVSKSLRVLCLGSRVGLGRDHSME